MFLINEIQYIKISEDNYLMINLINGAADYINGQIFKNLSNNNLVELDNSVLEAMRERRYLFNNEAEYQIFIYELNIKLEELENNCVPSFLIIPSYACNLKCTYCYEQTYNIQHTGISNKKKIIDEQFNVISKIIESISHDWELWSNKDIKITIMWGEPLLPSNKMIISYILKKISLNWYRANFVTNWVDISSFIPDLKSDTVEHIQITLDGPKSIHNRRRIFHNGTGSFDLIISNIKNVLKNWIKTYLRVNVDKENIKNLPELANIITDNFSNNQNIHPYIYLLQDWWCSGEQNVLEESIGIEKIYELEKEYPNMSIFKKKFHPADFVESIFSNKAYQPVLRHCGAARNQYILDYKGNIYKCWHGIGNSDYRVGNFEKQCEFNEKREMWKNRSVENFIKCSKCKYRYICGTGCPAVKHGDWDTLDINKPNCVEYEKLINTLVLEYLNKS